LPPLIVFPVPVGRRSVYEKCVERRSIRRYVCFWCKADTGGNWGDGRF
jgi:hypothetical protein